MKSVQPEADLPPANAHIMMTYNSLPTRPHRSMPRNKTGIYQGTDVPPNSPRTYNLVPPLAKPRGMFFRPRTPTEKRRRAGTVPGQAGLAPEDMQSPNLPRVSTRQAVLSDDPDCLSTSLLYIYNHPCPAPVALPYTPPMILRLPILRPKQQQRVEALRVREEPRGFHPLPIRKAKPKAQHEDTRSLSQNSDSDQAPVLRKSARNFVAAANSGVTHLEDLGLEELSLLSLSSGRESSIPPSLIEDVQGGSKKMAGLEECYNKICKGNLSSLQTLLPARKATGPTGTRTKTVATPLTIRSFRNPRSPHSVVQYSDLRNKQLSPSNAKPPVPSPYYYSSKGVPYASDDGTSKVKLTRLPGSSRSSERILAAPGVGAISQSTLNRRAASLPSDPPQGIEGMPPPGMSSNAKFVDSDDRYSQKDGFRVPSGTPAVSTTDLHQIGSAASIQDALSQTTSSPCGEAEARMQPVAPPTSPARSRKHQAATAANHSNNSHSIPTGRASRGGSASLRDSSIVSEAEEVRPELGSGKSGVGSSQGSGGGSPASGKQTQGPATGITVSIQNDQGESHMLDLEGEGLEAEVEGDSQDQVSPTGHIDPDISKEWQEASEKKQEELKRLLEEHNEIVSHIQELEKMTGQEGDLDTVVEDS